MTFQSSYIFLKKEQKDNEENKILIVEVGHRISNYIMKLFPDASSEKITDKLFKQKITYVTTARLSQISLKKSRPAVLRKVSGAKAQNLIGA